MNTIFDHEDGGPTGMVTSWGERVYLGDRRYYSWLMPAGTPVLAAESGTVIFNGRFGPVRCYDGTVVPGSRLVYIEHTAPSGQHFATTYSVLSAVGVTVGQLVVAGQQIGVSGGMACSPDNTVFGFSVRPEFPLGEDALSRFFGSTDPYGWSGSGPDPYLLSPRGVNSEWLWLPGEAPPIYRENLRPLGMDPVVTLTRWRWMTDADASDPNNEFIELSLHPSAGSSLDLTGYTLVNEVGDVFNLPSGTVVSAGVPLRVYSGLGSNGPNEIYMGRSTPIWDNLSDCANLLDAQGVEASRTCIYYHPLTSN
jgi:hypothetical protein